MEDSEILRVAGPVSLAQPGRRSIYRIGRCFDATGCGGTLGMDRVAGFFGAGLCTGAGFGAGFAFAVTFALGFAAGLGWGGAFFFFVNADVVEVSFVGAGFVAGAAGTAGSGEGVMGTTGEEASTGAAGAGGGANAARVRSSSVTSAAVTWPS